MNKLSATPAKRKLPAIVLAFVVAVAAATILSASAYASATGDCSAKNDENECQYDDSACSISRDCCVWNCQEHFSSQEHSPGKLTVYHTDGVTCESCGRTYINSVEISSVDTPKTGFSLDTTARCATVGVATTTPTITWKVDGTVQTGNAQANTTYTAEITLNTTYLGQEGNFCKTVSATVNGQAATVKYDSECQVTVSYTFAPTGEQSPLFDNCMGTVATTQPSYIKGSTYTVHDSVQYTFAGWFTEPNGTGDEKTSGFEEGVTYYAKWENAGKTVVTTTLSASSNIPADSGITWSQNTLTLNNATIDTLAPKAIVNTGELTVVVLGNNVVESRYTGEVPDDGLYNNNDDPNKVAGIYNKGNLTIQGSGTLTISSGGFSDLRDITSYSNAIWAKGLTIDGVTLNAESGDVNTGTKYACGYSMAIYSKTAMSINNAKVTAKSGNGGSDIYNGFSMGINAANSIEISNSTVTAESGTAAQDSAGIFAGPGYAQKSTPYGEDDKYLANITISNSTVTATGAQALNFTSNGIYAHNNIYIYDSTIVAANGIGEESNETTGAIFRNQDLVINNSKVTAKGYSGAIDTFSHVDETDQGQDVAYGKTFISNNSEVTATALDDAPAMLACSTLNIADSTLTCTAQSQENTALLFDDPNHAADTIDGLVITGTGKIVTNGVVKVGDTDSSNPYNFGNTSDKNYYVKGSETTRLNGTINAVYPQEGQTMIISLQEIKDPNDGSATSALPETGDNNNLMLCFGLLSVLLLASATALCIRVRQKESSLNNAKAEDFFERPKIEFV